LRIHKASLRGDLPVELFLQKHDEIGVRYREADEQRVTAGMIELMEEHFVLTAPDGAQRDWYVPAEMLVGWNLGHRNKERHYAEDGQPFATLQLAEAKRDGLLTPSTECEIEQEGDGWVVIFIPNPDGLIELKGTDKRARKYDPWSVDWLTRVGAAT